VSEGVGLLSAAVWCPEAPFYTTAAPGLTHRTLRASTVCCVWADSHQSTLNAERKLTPLAVCDAPATPPLRVSFSAQSGSHTAIIMIRPFNPDSSIPAIKIGSLYETQQF